MHRADRLGRLDLGQRLARVEVGGRFCHLVDQFFRPGQIVDLERGEQFVPHLGELKRPTFVLAREQADARHEFPEGESFGEALDGAVEFTLLEKEFVSLDTLVDVADGLVGQAVDLTERTDQFAQGLGRDGRSAGQAFDAEVFQSEFHPAGGKRPPAASIRIRAVVDAGGRAIRPGPYPRAPVAGASRGSHLRVEFGIDPGLAGVPVHRERFDHPLVDVDRIVPILVDRAVEAVGHEHVLEAARGEILHDEGLQMPAGIEFGQRDAQFVVFDGLGDVRKNPLGRGHFGVTGEPDVFLLGGDGCIAAAGHFERRGAGRHHVVPFRGGALFLEKGVFPLEVFDRLKTDLRRVDRIRHGAAKVGIILVFRSFGQEGKGLFDVCSGRIARGEQLKDTIDRLAIGHIGGAGCRRCVEILFEARAEQPVVVDVPDFTVEGGNLAPRVEGGNIPADEALVHLGGARPAGGGRGIARALGVLLRAEKRPREKDKDCGQNRSHDFVSSLAYTMPFSRISTRKWKR